MDFCISDLKRFEDKFSAFCILNRLSKDDPFVWNILLSHGLVGGGTYMPFEFVWNTRHRPWDWDVLKSSYELAEYAHSMRDRPWSYSRLLRDL